MSRHRDDFTDAPILAELGALLERRAASPGAVSGAADQGRRRATRRSAAPRLRSTLPIALSVTVALVIATVALVGHGHQATPAAGTPPAGAASPPIFPPPDPAVARYVLQAQVYVASHDAGCSLSSSPATHRTFSDGAPSRAMLSAFGIFRRPAVPTDRPPRGYGDGASVNVRGIFVKYVRRAQYRYGAGYYLTPAANVLGYRKPSRCFAAQTAALHRELPKIPVRLRARAVRAAAEQIAFQRYQQLHPEGICVVELNNAGFGGGGCGAILSQQERYPGLGGSHGDIQYGLVPDGIASITYRYAATRSVRAFTITVAVINNLVVYKASAKLSTKLTVILRAANGHVIRTFRP
jgi:hypothetical protein